MIDQQLARLRTYRSNIQRYRNLLQTSLTELERKFVRTVLGRRAIKAREPDPTPYPMTFAGQTRGDSGNALFAGGLTMRSDCSNVTR